MENTENNTGFEKEDKNVLDIFEENDLKHLFVISEILNKPNFGENE